MRIFIFATVASQVRHHTTVVHGTTATQKPVLLTTQVQVHGTLAHMVTEHTLA